MPSLSRRDLLRVFVAVAGAPAVLAAAPALAGRPGGHIFVDESRPSEAASARRPLVVGGLIAADPDRHIGFTREARLATGYRRTLEYSSTDRHKLPYARSVIDYFFATPDLRFCALIACERSPDIAAIGRRFGFADLPLAPTDLRADCRMTKGGRRGLSALLGADQGSIRPVRNTDAADRDLLQFADLLTGCVLGDARGVRSTVKSALIGDLKARLGVAGLSDGCLAEHPKFRVVAV